MSKVGPYNLPPTGSISINTHSFLTKQKAYLLYQVNRSDASWEDILLSVSGEQER